MTSFDVGALPLPRSLGRNARRKVRDGACCKVVLSRAAYITERSYISGLLARRREKRKKLRADETPTAGCGCGRRQVDRRAAVPANRRSRRRSHAIVHPWRAGGERGSEGSIIIDRWPWRTLLVSLQGAMGLTCKADITARRAPLQTDTAAGRGSTTMLQAGSHQHRSQIEDTV